MQKKLTKGKESNYEIVLSVTEADNEKAKAHILKEFQKDLALPGFRKGFAPMNMVEENIKPEYLAIGMYENLINSALQEIIKESPMIRFIGEPYALDQKKEGDITTISLKLDVFPEVEIKDDKRKEYELNTIETQATKEEVDEALLRLKKNYADYKDANKIALDTISKINMDFLDKDGNSVDKGHLYVWEQEFEEFKFCKDTFIGKSKGDIFEIPYVEKDLPPTMQTKKTDAKAKTIKLEIKDVKQIILPEINAETIKKLFGNDSQVKNEAELVKYIEDSIAQQKFDTELIKQVEEYLSKVRAKHMNISIPHTLLDEELKVRIKNLEQRFGGVEKMEQYFKQMGEEKAKAFLDDIKNAANESLEKFFILQNIAEALELEIDWQKQQSLEVENKLYQKLALWAKTSKKAEKEEKTEKPAKKAKK